MNNTNTDNKINDATDVLPVYNIKNLLILYRFIVENKEAIRYSFKMNRAAIDKKGMSIPFHKVRRNSTKELLKCGTNCCLLGWSATIPEFQGLSEGKNFWHEYSTIFVNYRDSSVKKHKLLNSVAFDYIFGGNWGNSVDEAIERLEYVLRNGVPTTKYIQSKGLQHDICFHDKTIDIYYASQKSGLGDDVDLMNPELQIN